MQDFIHTLRKRYASMIEHRPMDAEQGREAAARLNALRLAEAVLRKIMLNEQHPQHPLHIGILGPTQSGKSTLVNLLMGSETAGVSALAGYTVHAQGFTSSEAVAGAHHSDSLFPDFSLRPAQQLQHENYRQYAVEYIPPADSADAAAGALAQAVLWDTPDFDSIESGSYRSAVLRIAALADMLVLMVSKDKYADKSVWDMLALLQPLGKPLLVCINKLNEPDTEVVVSSFLQRYETHIHAQDTPEIVTLPYVKGLDKRASQIAQRQREKLLTLIRDAGAGQQRPAQRGGAYRFIARHWDAWMTPVLAEQQADSDWRQAIDAALESGMQRYRDAYLEHPQKYETFNRALAELLILLEIPGLAGTLGTTRKIVTWPVRKLMQLGKTVLDQSPAAEHIAADLEDSVLQQAAQHVLTQLGDVILDARNGDQEMSHWWSALSQALDHQQADIQQEFERQREAYQQAFKPQIDAAARKLYASLQEQPAMLNSLRAARVSTDAAAVVLAVHSGGLAASDLVLAPAMLSLTTMLTEGALGRYLEHVKADLKALQGEQVRQDLFENVLRQALYTLPASLGSDSGHLRISEHELDNALQLLRTEIDEN